MSQVVPRMDWVKLPRHNQRLRTMGALGVLVSSNLQADSKARVVSKKVCFKKGVFQAVVRATTKTELKVEESSHKFGFAHEW